MGYFGRSFITSNSHISCKLNENTEREREREIQEKQEELKMSTPLFYSDINQSSNAQFSGHTGIA